MIRFIHLEVFMQNIFPLIRYQTALFSLFFRVSFCLLNLIFTLIMSKNLLVIRLLINFAKILRLFLFVVISLILVRIL